MHAGSLPPRGQAEAGQQMKTGALRISTAAALLVLAAAGAAAQPRAPTPPAPAVRTITVLPFRNLSGAAADEWIGGGIAETLGAALTVAPTAAFVPPEDLGRAHREATGTDLDAADAAAVLETCRALGIRWLVVGEYQRVADHLRVTARVVATESGAAVHWMQADSAAAGLFDLQDRLVDSLARYLEESGGPPRAGPDAPGRAQQPAARRSAGPAARVGAALPRAGFGPPAGTGDGPAAPQPPATISRDAAGRATIRAVRVAGLDVDGVLDEAVYRDLPPFSDFIQTLPVEGAPASERTEVWVLFDDDNFYLGVRCWDSAPESRWVANEMRRDSFNILQNERIGFMIDSFYDRRNGMIFNVNAIGGRMEGQMTSESDYNGDWNPVWEAETGRFEGGWTLEAAIPFKSLRYRPGRAQIWGLNVSRRVFWKNELSYVVPMPVAREPGAIFLSSLAATLVGLEVPDRRSTLELKPYAIADLTSDWTTTPPVANQLGGDGGLDVKYGVTQNLVADLTLNTDFAQVEADEQQVNLTRFSLFFPEKREFFLENQGVFAFGGAGTGPFGQNNDTPVLFYSRQIGLNAGREVPLQAGGRLTGRVGRFTVGAMTIRTGAEATTDAMPTSFSVLRIKRDLLRRSSIGAIYTGRSVSTLGPGSSETYGADANFGFYDTVNVDTYWARTATPGSRGDDVSYRARFEYRGDRYGVQLEHLAVGEDFRPDVGFLRREDFDRSFGSFRFSPRPYAIRAIRRFTWEGRFDYYTSRAGVVETRLGQGFFAIEFENADQFEVEYTRSYEYLDSPFEIARDVAVPVGGYRFQDTRVAYQFGRQRVFSGMLALQRGSFYGGEKTTLEMGLPGGFRSGRLELTPQLSLEPGISYNRVDLPQGRFTTGLVTTRTTYTATPLMFVSALVQYNSSNASLGANVRFRWEYQPGSELFVVYNEQRDTLTPRHPELQSRSFVIKINRLFRF